MKVFIPLTDIENVSRQELIERRLHDLQFGFSPLDQVLQNSSDPITLDRKFGKPFRIIDGRHRIFLARQKGYQGVFVNFV